MTRPLLAEEFWEKGVPLRNADWHFAPISLRSMHRCAHALSMAFEPRGEPSDATPWGYPLNFQWPASDRLGAMSQRAEELFLLFAFELRTEMRNRLLRALAAGELLGYGFEIPRRPNDFPIELPHDAFKSGDMSWPDATIDSAGHEFALVRIIRPEQH